MGLRVSRRAHGRSTFTVGGPAGAEISIQVRLRLALLDLLRARPSTFQSGLVIAV